MADQQLSAITPLAAATRYNARLHSNNAHRGRRALQELVVENLVAQCNGSIPLVDGLRALTEPERKYACKAINDFRDTLEYEGLLDRVIDLFIIITGKPYNGESVDQMTNEVRKVKVFLYEQAQLFGLFGDMKEIHAAVVLEELLSYDAETLVDYCTLMFISIPDEYQDVYNYPPHNPIVLSEDKMGLLQTYTLFGKLAHLERLRIRTWEHDTLFSDANIRPIRYEGALTFYDAPLGSDVIRRGLNYHYPRVGALTNEELISRYHPYELLCVLSQLDRGKMVATWGWNSYDITSHIITTLQKRGWDDPRGYVTPFGIRNNVYSPGYFEQLTLARDFRHSYEDLRDACSREGIRVEGWHGRPRAMRDLMHDYIVAQLGEDFYMEPPPTKHVEEISLGVYVSVDTLIPHGEPRSDVLWYGDRNGFGMFRCMTFKCLADCWTKYQRFACPFNTEYDFPIRTIRRLAYVLKAEGITAEAHELATVLSSLLWPATRLFTSVSSREAAYIDSIFEEQSRLVRHLRSAYTRNRLGVKLVQLYNLGLYLSNWTDEGPIQLVKDNDIEDALGLVRNNMLWGLTSIGYSLKDVPELLKLRIVRILAEAPTAERGSPEWVKQRAPYPVLEIENNAATLGEYLQLLISAHRLGVDHMLEHAALVIQFTAEKYAKEIIDTSLMGGFIFEIEKPELRIVEPSLTYEWDLRPALLDIIKGESIPADISDGKWQELPLLTS